MPRTSQPHSHSTAKVTPAKVLGSQKFDFVSSQEDSLYKVGSILRLYMLCLNCSPAPFKLRTFPLSSRGVTLGALES